MNTRQWLARRGAQQGEMPRLEDALLGIGALRYAAYRLKYVLVRALLRTAFRLVELALFASAFSFELLGPVLWIRSLMLVGEALWWGALETLRRDVRRSGSNKTTTVRTIQSWLALAAGISALILGASVSWVLVGAPGGANNPALIAFVVGAGLRWALDTWVRTYHSGVYAVRRVYRPAWSLLLVDVADVVVFVLAYLWLGPIGLGAAFAAVGTLRAALSVAFIQRVYRQLDIAVGPVRAWFRSLRRARWEPSHSVRSALGNAVAQVDALLVLGLLLAPGNAEGTLMLAVLFHGIAPLQTAAFSWSRLFYFDFKRLEAWGSPLLLERFERFVSRVAMGVPVPIGLVTWALLAALWRGSHSLLSLELFILAAVRARLSLLHVRAFSLGDNRFLGKLFFGMLAVVCSTQLLGQLAPEVFLGAVTAMAALGLFALGRSTSALAAPARNSLGLAAWMWCLSEQRGAVSLGLVQVDRRLTSVARCLRALRPALDGALTARLGKDTFVWFVPVVDGKAGIDLRRLVMLGAGTLRDACVASPEADGAKALTSGLPRPLWQRRVNAYVQSRVGIDLDGLVQSLQAVAPGVSWVSLSAPRSLLQVVGQNSRALRGLILDATRGHTGLRRVGDGYAAVLAPAGKPKALFLFPTLPPTTRAWQPIAGELLRRAELAMTWKELGLEGAAAPPAD